MNFNFRIKCHKDDTTESIGHSLCFNFNNNFNDHLVIKRRHLISASQVGNSARTPFCSNFPRVVHVNYIHMRRGNVVFLSKDHQLRTVATFLNLRIPSDSTVSRSEEFIQIQRMRFKNRREFQMVTNAEKQILGPIVGAIWMPNAFQPNHHVSLSCVSAVGSV